MKNEEIVLEIKPKFKLSYEILRHIETIFIFLLLTIFVVINNQFILLYLIVFIGYLIGLILYILYIKKRYKMHSYKIYKDRICYSTFYTREKREVLLKNIKNIRYSQSFTQKFFKLGEITIKTNDLNIFKNHFTMEYIDNVGNVYNQMVEICKEK